MKNSNNNQNDDDIVEEMSFSDFLIELPLKFFFAIVTLLWTIAMSVVIIYVKFVR